VIEQSGKAGRPRSEDARQRVLHAVDDLLQEVGYANLTMKGIAEQAGVGRQTVYRWWSTKAEILLEASIEDAQEELTVVPTGDPLEDLTLYLEALVRFLAGSSAGAAYRAVVAAAQHDPAVAELISGHDVLGASARAVLESVLETLPRPADPAGLDRASALLIGPAFYWIISGRDARDLPTRSMAQDVLGQLT